MDPELISYTHSSHELSDRQGCGQAVLAISINALKWCQDFRNKTKTTQGPVHGKSPVRPYAHCSLEEALKGLNLK